MKTSKGFSIIILTVLISVQQTFILLAGDRLTDSLALVALYDSTDGHHWSSNSGWKTDGLDDWYGVTLKNDRVDEISLSNNNLTGPIP